MLGIYLLNDQVIDSLDLKTLVVSHGVKISSAVYKRFGKTHRLTTDLMACNCMILPDGTIVHLTDLALHAHSIPGLLSRNVWIGLKYSLRLKTPFALEIDADGAPVLRHDGADITTVTFPKASRFYQQKTSTGLPYLGNAVLQGTEFLSFQCLWPCDYACAGQPCQFCYFGAVFEREARTNKRRNPGPTPGDVAEIVRYAVHDEKSAMSIQLTGGSTINTQAECRTFARYLDEIDRVAGLAAIPGEIIVYTTPPADPTEIDRIFDAGAHKVACSLEVWDEGLANVITPGKIKFAGRKRYLECLSYIAEKHGPNRACSSFIIGIEPAESFLAGADFLAGLGIVPLASIWIPFGRPVLGLMKAPGLEYYRRIKEGLSDIYARYKIIPPGGNGLNVCFGRDIWKHQNAIAPGF